MVEGDLQVRPEPPLDAAAAQPGGRAPRVQGERGGQPVLDLGVEVDVLVPGRLGDVGGGGEGGADVPEAAAGLLGDTVPVGGLPGPVRRHPLRAGEAGAGHGERRGAR
ncbi:hypothetical protein [Streptomyces sp. DG1A-41]|uniref:hypothetical protein n=1 Tax=Streptomyces sp. DG1A-41 TaxID=3125779 RepID=UPI0030CABBA5